MTNPELPAPAGAPPNATLRRPRFSLVWLIPIIAAVLAIYLVYRTISQQGPLMELTFKSADGLTAGQTQIKYKYLAIGTVQDIDLAGDNSHVIVKIRMTNVGARFLNSHARFWVVRPSFSFGNVSGLDTLVSGAYIAVDPGTKGGTPQTHFIGLEGPPGVQSDEPGSIYTLLAENVGSINAGSPVFYRDVVVGEVLNYDIGDGVGPITVHIFVRAPFNKLVKPQSHFWNSSGITASIVNGTFHLEIQSLQAAVAGGITFDLPPNGEKMAASPNDASFPLFASADAARVSGYQRKIELVTYIKSSVGGLATGAPLTVMGMQVGQVTSVNLIYDVRTGSAKVRVGMELQPERIFKASLLGPSVSPLAVIQNLVNRGLRTQITTTNYVTGQQTVALINVPDSLPAKVTVEDGAIVIPNQPGSFDNITASLSDISKRLAKIPFDQIGMNLNKLLVTANGTIGSPQLKQTLVSLNQTLQSANMTLGTINQSFGGDSDFQHNLEQLMNQASNTLRSIDLLTTYLDRHPSALLTGRSGQ
jgi:paraquat-inducible protein B